jgi:hypothetical protein
MPEWGSWQVPELRIVNAGDGPQGWAARVEGQSLAVENPLRLLS